MVIDGKAVATQILTELKNKVSELKKEGKTPHLYVILLINDPSTLIYIKQKKLKAEEIGAKITIDDSKPDISEEELLNKIEELNKNNDIDGIIVQRPLPIRFDEEKITNAITPEKDIDGFRNDSKFGIPVGLAVIKLIQTCHPKDFEKWLQTQNITIIGNGKTAGEPIVKTFEKLRLTPNIITSKTENPDEIIKKSDIVISCVGKQNIVSSNNIKRGVILIGVGMHMEDGKLKGDFEESEIENIASFYSPTPGGVGPVNVASLMRNLIIACDYNYY